MEEAAYIEDYLTRKYEGVAVYPPAGSDGGGEFFCGNTVCKIWNAKAQKMCERRPFVGSGQKY